MNTNEKKLLEQNKRLRSALAGLIPWAGEKPDGPGWATEDAKNRNIKMFESALNAACECFDEDHGSSRSIAASN